MSEENIKKLVVTLKDKQFAEMRKWVIQNLDKEPAGMFTDIYNILYVSLEPASVIEQF